MQNYRRTLSNLINRQICAVSLVLFLMAGVSFAAESSYVAPWNSTAYYQVTWSGIRIGGMVLSAKETKDSYRLDSIVKTKGLAKIITKHSSTTSIEGHKKAENYLPGKYETLYKHRKSTRHIIMSYDPEGKLVGESNEPAETARPPVQKEMKERVVDLLTPMFQQRGKIAQALAGGESDFTIRSYDGRRLTDMKYHVKGRKKLDRDKQPPMPVIEFSISRTPIAGYKASEIEEYKAGKDPEVTMYMSDDGAMIPVQLVVGSSMGPIYARYDHACPSLEACRKGL